MQQQPNDSDFPIRDKTADGSKPTSQLDIYDKAIRPPADDEFLQRVNLGLGNYTTKEYYQQLDTWKKGMYAESAFGDPVHELAVQETKHELGKRGWEYIGENGQQRTFGGWNDKSDRHKQNNSRRKYIEERGEEIWMALDERQRIEAMHEFAGSADPWDNPFYRMVMTRNEGSRGKGARLLDNVFGRVREMVESASEQTKSKLSLGDNR